MDLLYFVQIPETINDSVKVFLAPNHTKIYQTKLRPAGKYRIYPLNKCILIKVSFQIIFCKIYSKMILTIATISKILTRPSSFISAKYKFDGSIVISSKIC